MARRKWTDEQLIEAVKRSQSWADVRTELGIKKNLTAIKNRATKLDLNTHHLNEKILSERTRELISKGRKLFLSKNKSNHNWSRFRGQETKPESNFREVLLSLGITATQFYTPPESKREFELDFALPNLKIGFEVNGQQHYNFLGTLAPYYKERHDYLVSLGWVIHEIHYSECLYPEKIQELIKNCLAFDRVEYSSEASVVNYRPIKKAIKLETKNNLKKQNLLERINLLPDGKEKQNQIALIQDGCAVAKNFPRPNARKAIRPSKENLEKLLLEKPTIDIANNYGVSESAITKWCKYYGLNKPPRGYWIKNSSTNVVAQAVCQNCSNTFPVKKGRVSVIKYCSVKCKRCARYKRNNSKF